MAIVVTKLVREERQRSEARVAALAELSAERVAATMAPTTPLPTARPPRRLAQPVSAGDIEIMRPSVPLASVPTLFAEPERSSPWGRRLAVIGTLATVVILAALTALSSTQTRTPSEIAPPPPQAVQAAPLELVSLSYQQGPDRMTITGLVQNPRAGAPLSRVAATAFLFGADGTFLASGRAPLDYTLLAPGDESPFVISVPVTGTVARYRVGFRGEDGRVIAHVDRRAVGTLADRGIR